jgi:hypothetical protein
MSNNTRLIVRTRPAREQSTAFLTAEQPDSPISYLLLSPQAAVEMAEELILRIQGAIRPQVPWTMTAHADHHEYFLRWSGLAGDVQLRFMVSVFGVNAWLHDRHGSSSELSGIAPLASWVLTRQTDEVDGPLRVVRYGENDAATPLSFDHHSAFVDVPRAADGKAELGTDIATATNQWLRVVGA